VLDIDAEAARRVEEAEALVEPEARGLAILLEAGAIGPLGARDVVAEIDLDLRVMFSLIGRRAPVSGSVSRVRWNCRFMSILAPEFRSGRS
jgi:hypothetical protein